MTAKLALYNPIFRIITCQTVVTISLHLFSCQTVLVYLSMCTYGHQYIYLIMSCVRPFCSFQKEVVVRVHARL